MRGRSDQPKGQLTSIGPLIPFHEIRDRSGDLAHLQIAAAAQFAGDVLGNIFRLALGGIEGDDADRVTILARSIGLELPFRGRWSHNRLRARRGLIHHQVDRLIDVVRDYRRRPISLRIMNSTQYGIKLA